jgi:hypothetical protein
VDEVFEIWPEPESQLLRLAFLTAYQNRKYLDCLTARISRSACHGALVYGWSPGDSLTAVRLTGVPAILPEAAIMDHFGQFGRVTCMSLGSPCQPLSCWLMHCEKSLFVLA